jgi:hypothetical protein
MTGINANAKTSSLYPRSVSALPQQQGTDEFLYEQAIKRIEGQEADLNEARQRALTVGSFGVGASGLLGAFVFDKAPHDVVGIVALVVFVLAVGALGRVVFPRRGWNFRLTSTVIAEHYSSDTGETDLRKLALAIDAGAKDNQTKLDGLMTWLGWGLILLGLETVLWLVALAVR